MVRSFCALVLAALIAAPALAEHRQEAGEIRAAMDAFAATWNKHDPKAIAAHFCDDAHVINPAGRVARGAAEIEKLFADEHTTFMRESTFSVRDVAVEKIDDDVYWFDAELTIDGVVPPPGAPHHAPNQFHLTGLVHRDDGVWKFYKARPYVFLPPPPAAQ